MLAFFPFSWRILNGYFPSWCSLGMLDLVSVTNFGKNLKLLLKIHSVLSYFSFSGTEIMSMAESLILSHTLGCPVLFFLFLFLSLVFFLCLYIWISIYLSSNFLILSLTVLNLLRSLSKTLCTMLFNSDVFILFFYSFSLYDEIIHFI